VSDWDERSIGLVLSGGGAKGAYEIGCWKALRRAGIKDFTAVAGTSIGAINGYLVCAGDIQRAEQLWRAMGAENPLRTSWPRIVAAVLERYALALMYSAVLFAIEPAVGFIGLAVGLFIPVALGEFLLPHEYYPLRALLVPFVAVAMAGTERLLRHGSLSKQSIREVRRFVQFGFPLELRISVALLLGLGVPFAFLVYDVFVGGFSARWLLLIVPVLILAAIAAVLIEEAGLSSFGEVSLFSGRPLRAIISAQLDASRQMPSRPALYVTRLKEEVVIVPGKKKFVRRQPPDWMVTRNQFGRRLPNLDDLEMAEFKEIDVTETILGLEYNCLAGKPMSEVAHQLLSTSAIAGFLPTLDDRLSGGDEADLINWLTENVATRYYDAGLIDNTPIAPLLEFEKCDLIVVILLNHKIADAKSALEHNLGVINSRLRELNDKVPDDNWKAFADLSFIAPVRVEADKLADVEILPIIPSKSLGRFVGGTLLFNPEKVDELIALGEKDTDNALQAFERARRCRPD